MKYKIIIFVTLFLNFLAVSPIFAKEHTKQAPLKIAYVIDTYDQLKCGAIISAYRFIDILKEKHEITVITTGRPSGENDEDNFRREKISGFYIPMFKNKMKKNGFKFGWPKEEQLRKIFQQSDIIYIHLPFYLGIKAMKIAKEMGKPVVVGFHLQPENMLLNAHMKYDHLVHWLYKLFIKKFYNMADMVVCPSEFAEKILRNNKHFKGTTVIISNGLTKEFRPTPSESFPENKDKFVILTVGRLAKEKRHDVIINAIAKSKYKENIQLIITGDGDLRYQLQELGKKLPLTPKVGFVSKDDLIRYYNTSDLYIHASEVELEGMSVLEAIGSGLPAIISDAKTSASKKFVLAEEFLFKSGSASDLSKKIDYWYEHRMDLKQKGFEYAKSAEKYYIENSAKEMSNLFIKISANNSQQSKKLFK